MKTVGKALDILESVLRFQGSVGLADLSTMTGLNISTTNRLAAFLVKRGYLYQKSKGDKYSLGFKLLQFNNRNIAANVKEQADPYLKKLADDVHETIVMGILDGVEQTSISVIPCKDMLTVFPEAGHKAPLHCTALGKIFLAYMPVERSDNIIDTIGLTAYTERTITDKAILKHELATIRRDGFALDDEEYNLGIRSAAAPVQDDEGHVLAVVSVVAPTIRMSILKMKQISPVIINYALKISQLL